MSESKDIAAIRESLKENIWRMKQFGSPDVRLAVSDADTLLARIDELERELVLVETDPDMLAAMAGDHWQTDENTRLRAERDEARAELAAANQRAERAAATERELHDFIGGLVRSNAPDSLFLIVRDVDMMRMPQYVVRFCRDEHNLQTMIRLDARGPDNHERRDAAGEG